MNLYSRLYPRDVVSGPGVKCLECPLEAARNTIGVERPFGTRCEFHRVSNAAGVGGVYDRRRGSGVCRACGDPCERNINGTYRALCVEHRRSKQAHSRSAKRKKNLVMQNGGRRPLTYDVPNLPRMRLVIEL